MAIASTCRHRERRRHRHSRHCRSRERHRHRTHTAARAIAIGNTWRSRENTRLAKRLSLLQSSFGREDKPRTRQLGLLLGRYWKSRSPPPNSCPWFSKTNQRSGSSI
jgi:hypothetical protein